MSTENQFARLLLRADLEGIDDVTNSVELTEEEKHNKIIALLRQSSFNTQKLLDNNK